MRIVGLFCSLLSAAFKQFLHQHVWPDEKKVKAQLPPIRYDGDPTEIYLA